LGLKELKMIAKHLDRTLSEDELNVILKRVDKNKNGAINFEEFLEYMSKINYGPPSIRQVEHYFKMFDRDNRYGFVCY
jgi:Ca2+-binding EF-hand superfamily protein